MPPFDDRTDPALVDAINAGDDAAFAALYARYKQWVVNLALRFTGDAHEALDVLQETFAYLLRKTPNLRLSGRLTTFLYPVVRNLSLEMRRKRRPPADEALLAEQVVVDAGPSELAQLVARLPPGQQEVLLMRFVDDLSLDEIAEALAIPLGTVKSRLHHAIATLRADPAIRDYFDQPQ